MKGQRGVMGWADTAAGGRIKPEIITKKRKKEGKRALGQGQGAFS